MKADGLSQCSDEIPRGNHGDLSQSHPEMNKKMKQGPMRRRTEGRTLEGRTGGDETIPPSPGQKGHAGGVVGPEISSGFEAMDSGLKILH